MNLRKNAKSLLFAGLAVIGSFSMMGPAAYGAGAGYSQFFIPGDEDLLAYALRDLQNQGTAGTTMHSLVAVTAWADNTIVIVDHWEDGYEYDITNPTSSYDELFTLNFAGDAKLFEDASIPLGRTVNPNPAFCNASADEADDSVCAVDGRDILYVIGTSATVTRATWIEGVDTFQALAWEVYPVRPQLIKYILPFGEELNAQGLLDFERVYALIQATNDNTVLEIDFNGDGTADSFDHDYNGSLDGTQMVLDKGEVYLLDRRSNGNAATPLLTGTTILGSETLQVQYLVGDQGSNFELRGLSAFPRGFWDDEYYAPVDQANNGVVTDIYLYNPNSTDLTINWESSTGSGSFVIGTTNRTVSFIAQPGASIPQGGAIYLRGSDVFWGVSSIDAEGQISDWGYSLVPRSLLDTEYYLGWAPAYAFSILTPPQAADEKSGLFITAAQDNTTVYVDEDVDGIPDQTITLDRLESAYVTSSDTPASLNDDDLSRARIYATGPYAMAYGQNPDNSFPGDNPALDLGYTVLPTTDRWFDLVLDVQKSANPTLLAASTIGQQTTFTVRAYTVAYGVDDLVFVDTLPAGFEYVAGSTVVTLPDNTTVTGAAADDGNLTGATTLTWSGSDVFGAYASLAANQAISISFVARTTVNTFGEGALATNNVTATGTRTVQGIDQVFTATDFAFVTFSNSSMAITKTSDVNPLAYPGDIITYTVNVLNNGAAPLSNISLYDALPDGVRYVAASGTIALPSSNVRDQFGAVSYSNNDGSQSWSGNWVETDIHSTTPGPSDGFALVNGGALQLRYQTSNVRDDFTTSSYARQDGTNNWVGDWSETGDDGAPNTGTITVDAGNNNRVNIAAGAAGRAITRVASVSGGSATISFTLSDQGIDAGEGVIAEYDLGLGGGFVEIQRIDNNTLTGTNPLTISTAGASTVTLRFRTFGTWTGGDAAGIDAVNIAFNNAVGTLARRSANLAGATTSTLTFDFNRANVEATDTVVVEAASSSAGPFTTLATYNNGTAIGSKTFSLSPYISSDTTVRFRVTGGLDVANEFFSFDNINVAYDLPSVSVVPNDPPNFVAAANNYSLAVGQSLTLTFQVTVDDPLATNITQLTNQACATTAQISLPQCAEVTDQVRNPSAAAGEVGDLVWLDIDGDGIKDPGEPGLSNVEVTLKDDFGTPIAVVYTDANGAYRFTGIRPGNGYFVEVTAGLGAGLTQTAPVGRSDNRSNPFNLTSGQVYLDADLGYRTPPGTGTIGDYVWQDINADGIQDANELGLGGVTVLLYRDVDGDGIFEPGGDDGASIRSVVTAADGSYHFFGVDATNGVGTDDYFVIVDIGQPALSGYGATTFPQTSVADLGADEARLGNDFGFFPNSSPRYNYRDRVWFDPNEDQQDDGETGIAGVTVNLLNAARQVIASVTTDANGYFDFAGLQGSTFYYVEISDTNSILSDFFGTTAGAIAGERQISNLTADLDFTVEPIEPNFGYNAYGAVGDTVFNDLNGNGVQNPGEPGIGGVTVRLYTDANGNGIIDGADAVIRTLATDANGNYLFAGIPNGDYIVSVGSPPAGFSFTGTDSDGGTAGQQLPATVTTGGADLDADFGYQVTSNPRTLTGTLWNDADNDGTLDDAGRFANVTMELRDSGGTLIATTTTNASGNYSFAGLPAAAGYQVRVTDTNGVLNGYQTTFEVTEGSLNGPYNGLEIVNLSGGNASNINFGYYRPPVVPLAVSLSSFHAERGGRGTVFEWTTDNEVGNVGFYLLGQVNGEWVDVSADLIPSPVIDSSSRQHYSYESDRSDIQNFILVDVDVSGKARYHGPFGLGDSGVSQPPAQLQIDWVSVRNEHAAKVAARQAAVLSRGTPVAARLLIEADGLYRISYEALAAAGFDFAGRPVASMGLFDRNGAVPMAVVPNAPTFGPGMVIEFFGTESKSLYNKRNHYTLRTDRAGVIAELDAAAPSGSPQTTYQETTRIENDLKYTFGSPNGDPWYDTWVQAISGPASLNRTIRIEDLVPGAGSASLELGLWGVTYWPASPDHRVKASLNGVELVDETFDGHTTWNHQVAVDPSLLNTGSDALLEIQLPRDLPGVIYDIVAVDDYSITYPRRLTTRSAAPDRLYFSHSGAGAYRVDGFSSDNIVVYRREGDRMQRLTGSSVAWNGTSYQITFKGGGAADYYVQLGSSLLEPGVVPVPEPVALGAGPAKLLVIAHPDFISDVQPLVDYRTAQGYSADVVDVETIYERYSNGMVDPEAIRGYIEEAVATRATGYVLLVGGDSYDYRDRLGFGSLSFIPSIYAATDELITHAPVDPLYGDIDRDGTVDVPVGRLPVRTSAELAGIITKVQQFEAKNYVQTLLAATDKYDADQSVSFRTLSDQLLQPLAGSWAITHADVETMGLAAAKQQVKDSLNQGTAYAQYFGHSSQTLWSFDRLFQASEVGSLLNQGKPALVAQWGCWNNYVVDPQVSTMGSALLTAPDRGAAAVLGASTWTSTAGDLALGTYFLPLVTQPGWPVGDVLVSSKRNLASVQPGQHLGVQWGWTLLGDPLLVLQPLAAGSCQGNPATGDGDGDRICDDIDVCIGSDQIGDIDRDGVCYDRDLCVGFPDSADADGDGVPDGCDLCLGDDSLGDPDGDGICGSPEGDIFKDGFESGISSE